jgi:hypothetical protein
MAETVPRTFVTDAAPFAGAFSVFSVVVAGAWATLGASAPRTSDWVNSAQLPISAAAVILMSVLPRGVRSR